MNAGTAVASLDEVRLVNARFKQLAYLTDQLLHYMYMGYAEIQLYRDDFKSDVNTYLKSFVWIWNYIRLSLVEAEFHLVKDHFIRQLDLHEAISPFNEEFGESDHVDGNGKNRKFGCMQSAARRETAISRNHEMRTNSKIKVIKEEFNAPPKKQRGVTKDKEETIKTMRKQALDEIQFMMQNMNNSLQIEDLWKKVTDT